MSEKNNENITKSDSSFAPIFVDYHILPDSFNGHCLIKDNISIPKNVINVYTSYKLNHQLRNLNTYFTLGNCLFRSVKLTEHADLDKYKYRHLKGKYILIVAEGTTQGLNDTTLTTKAIYSINFTKPNKRIVLSLH